MDWPDIDAERLRNPFRLLEEEIDRGKIHVAEPSIPWLEWSVLPPEIASKPLGKEGEMAHLDLDVHFMEVYRKGWRECEEAGADVGGQRTKTGISALIADPTFQAAMAELLVKKEHVSYAIGHQMVHAVPNPEFGLGKIIERLRLEDPNKVVMLGFKNPHSYRGDYAQLGVEPYQHARVGDMLDCLEHALGRTFEGWKGGDYTMTEWAEVWLSREGETSDDQIGSLLLELLLTQQVSPLVSSPPHRYQPENRHGFTCHYPGCTLPRMEHTPVPLPEAAGSEAGS